MLMVEIIFTYKVLSSTSYVQPMGEIASKAPNG